MSRVLLDVNVVLDLLAAREPFVDDAEAVFQLASAGDLDAFVAAHTITTLHFLLARDVGRSKARDVLVDLLHLVRVAAVDGETIRAALAAGWRDFEDAVQATCAERERADYLVTRDKKGFAKSAVPAVTPGELVALASST